MNDSMPNQGCVPLIAMDRGGFLEGVHRGSLAVVDSRGGVLASVGNISIPVLLRSGAKPFQLTTVLETGAAEQFGLSTAELAVAAASHSAEPKHIETVRSMLEKIGVDESALRCGVHPFFMSHVACEMARANQSSQPIHNNCSGKHAAMMAACKAKGWTLDDYENRFHPLQQRNLQVLADFSGLENSSVGMAVDGCTVPTFGIPLQAAALAYARLADPGDLPQPLPHLARTVFKAMSQYPDMGSGRIGRLEAVIMRHFAGKVVAKVGAEGFFALGIAPGLLSRVGVGLALKLEDGITFNRASDPVVVHAMQQIGLLRNADSTSFQSYQPEAVLNCRHQVVGTMTPLFGLPDLSS